MALEEGHGETNGRGKTQVGVPKRLDFKRDVWTCVPSHSAASPGLEDHNQSVTIMVLQHVRVLSGDRLVIHMYL